jgi:hypothetical protein
VLIADATVHGDSPAFARAAAILALDATIAALLYEHGTKELALSASTSPADRTLTTCCPG